MMKRVWIGIVGVIWAALGLGGVSRLPAQTLEVVEAAGCHGGLVVQLGAAEADLAIQLSLTGRYLVHVLDADAAAIETVRSRLRQEGHYGLAWAEQHGEPQRLPYAENTVNLVVVGRAGVPAEELARAVAPGGVVLTNESGPLTDEQLTAAGFAPATKVGSYRAARKPWPAAMDGWSHPRHAADGNAVSQDTLVGPPQRVRWVAAATSEVEGMVTAGGRNFYGGVLARDSFNGLRLWHRNLVSPRGADSATFELPKLSRDGARPIATERLLFAVLERRPVALDAQTGEVVVEFGDMVSPRAILHDGTHIIAADAQSVRAWNGETGQQLWNVPASDPRLVVGDGQVVAFLQGNVRVGEPVAAVVLNAQTGEQKWLRGEYPWLKSTTRTVLAGDRLVFEVSTFNDHDDQNGIHVVAVENGEHAWSKNFPPGMNHTRQARAMHLADDLWILHGAKVNTSDPGNMTRQPVQVSALNLQTGQTRVTYPAGMTHCFPPVATPNFLFAGELDLTNLLTGEVVANRITKAHCSAENGWVPANGLVYTTPKHCTCWPMLRGFVAMAPATAEPSPVQQPADQIEFVLERGPGVAPDSAAAPRAEDWPLYRRDRWRSGGTAARGPQTLEVRWQAALNPPTAASSSLGPILHDWRENPVVKGPLSAPTIANGIAYVARPDAHELVALDAASGAIRWRFTATGRIDTPPAIHRGVCLFGSAAGWVYGLAADTGELIWRMRAAPTDERIVAYGQVESPWPVPGAVLVMDDVAYFAAGRQPLADGGLLVFAVDPLTGRRHWVRRIDSVPQTGFYENSGLEFDPFDILHAEGDGLTLSRWLLSRDGQDVSVDKWNAFARLDTGGGGVWVPRGSWSYGARHQHRFAGEASRRPLVTFRGSSVFSSLDGTTVLFRRDFTAEDLKSFQNRWITGWEAARLARENGKPYRTYRVAAGAAWSSDPFASPGAPADEPKPGTQLYNRVAALALTGDDRLFAVHEDGRLKVVDAETGKLLAERQVPQPAWDGLAIAAGRLYLSSQNGELICLGE